MVDDAQDEEDAALLFELAASGGTELPGVTDPGDLAGGARLQLAVLDRWRGAGERVGGWKLGLTAREGRGSLGVGFHPFGYILESRILRSGSTLPLARLRGPSVEPELCFTLAEDLPPRGGAEAARLAVASVAPAFEVKERRLPADTDGTLRLADNLKQWGIVVGDPHPVEGALEAAAEVFVDGAASAAAESGEGIEDHFASIAVLADVLATAGLRLEAGQRVITGSLSAARLVTGPGRWEARFPVLGGVVVEFS